jgi:hypothetical protein
MPFFILGRVAGMTEEAITAAWERKDSEALIRIVRQGGRQ